MPHSILTLLRHAKSSWNVQQQPDHERPLNKRGIRDAPEMAERLMARDSIPTLILCSSAQRTRETAIYVLSTFGDLSPQIQYLDALYLASADTLLAELEKVPDNISHVMVIAHNPGIEDLSAKLQGIPSDTMPTAAVRQFSCPSISGLMTQLANQGAQVDSEQAIKLIHEDYPKSIIYDKS
ncbi:MAG: histidine phosphatase family protein [Granulosicoccus sp.]